MNRLPECIQSLAATTQKRQRDEFLRWTGLPEDEVKERWSRLHMLYEFCQWIKQRDAWIRDVYPSGLVAVDGLDERRFAPEDGLDFGDWPYLKICREFEDEDIDRDEIFAAILTNQLRRRGYSVAVAGASVQELAIEADTTADSALWSAVEAVGYDEALEWLDERAKEIVSEANEYQRKRKAEMSPWPDGPGDGDFFWFCNRPFLLSPELFRFVSALWNAPGHRLSPVGVLRQVWNDRRLNADKRDLQKIRTCASRVGVALESARITISVSKMWDQDRLAKQLWVQLELP